MSLSREHPLDARRRTPRLREPARGELQVDPGPDGALLVGLELQHGPAVRRELDARREPERRARELVAHDLVHLTARLEHDAHVRVGQTAHPGLDVDRDRALAPAGEEAGHDSLGVAAAQGLLVGGVRGGGHVHLQVSGGGLAQVDPQGHPTHGSVPGVEGHG